MESKMGKIILEAKDLCKSYALNGVQNHVLNHIDLEVFEGDYTVVMGSSGAGKSTLLYCISGMDQPTSGTVTIGEREITRGKEKDLTRIRRKDIGFVFQQSHLVSNLSLFENVVVPGYLNKEVSHKDVVAYATELLETFGIDSIANHLPTQTSGGEQQRCAIARAMISRPKLLFADEPTGALNKKSGLDVLDLLTQVNEEGQSILMVTHDIRAAIRGNRLIYLEDGQIAGELELNKFAKEDAKAREQSVNAWLSSLEW